MRFFIFVLLLVLVTGCKRSNLETECQPTPKSKLVYEISNGVFEQLKTKKNLFPFECGGGSRDPIKSLHWGLLYYNDINIEESRELLITAANQFLEAFNSDERIRPFLATYPFQPENIEINIFLKNPDGSELGSGILHVISITEGVLEYMIQSPETHRLETIHKETFEEAEGKLNVPLQKAI